MMAFIDDLQAARVLLSTKARYYNYALFSVRFVASPGLNTLGVDDRGRLYYDPDLENGMKKEDGTRSTPWTVEEITTVLVHEMNHLLRNHSKRKPGIATTMAWNVAADAEINDDLESAGFKLPGEDFIHPEKFGWPVSLTAEEYFALMEKQAKQDKKDGKKPDPNGLPLHNGPGNGHCGSVVHGQKEEHEEGAGTEGMSEIDKDIMRRRVAQDVKEYAKTTGNMPGDLGRWADEILDAQVPWQREIAARMRNAFMHAKGMTDWSYRKPSYRRGFDMAEPIIHPGLYSPVPNICVIVDTSGSIGNKELDAALTEINGICKSMQASNAVTVISCDAEVHSVERVYDARQIRKMAGGGGTDMGIGIAKAKELKSQFIVVITDGYTPWPQDAPGVPIIVALINRKDDDNHGVPDYAHVVYIEPA